MSRKTIVNLIKFFLTILFLYLLFENISIPQLLEPFKQVDIKYFFITICIIIFKNFLSAYRWKIILEIISGKVRFHVLLSYYYIGIFFNNFLPTSIGGDIVRAGMLKKHGVDMTSALNSVVVERILGLISLFLLSLLGYVFVSDSIDNNAANYFYIIIALVFFVFAVIALNISKKGGRRKSKQGETFISKYIHVFSLLRIAGRGLWVSFILSLVFQFSIILSIYTVSNALIDTPSIAYFLFGVPIAIIASMLPVTINGLGVRENVFVYMFSIFGLSREQALLCALLWLLLNYFQSIIGYVLFLFKKQFVEDIIDYKRN